MSFHPNAEQNASLGYRFGVGVGKVIAGILQLATIAVVAFVVNAFVMAFFFS